MSRNYKDVIGNALWAGGWGPGFAAFGADGVPGPGPGPMPGAGALVPAPGYGMFPYPTCGLPEAGFDPNFPNRWLKSVAVGPACGPQESETIIGADIDPLATFARGAVVIVKYTPQIPYFKPYRVGMSSDCASAWVLTSLQGANQNLLGGAGNIPGLACSEVARGNWLNCVTVVGNQPIIATWVNASMQEAFLHSWIAGVGIANGGVTVYGGPHAQ